MWIYEANTSLLCFLKHKGSKTRLLTLRRCLCPRRTALLSTSSSLKRESWWPRKTSTWPSIPSLLTRMSPTFMLWRQCRWDSAEHKFEHFSGIPGCCWWWRSIFNYFRSQGCYLKISNKFVYQENNCFCRNGHLVSWKLAFPVSFSGSKNLD